MNVGAAASPIAVLVPTLGRPDSLRRALRSLQEQTRSDLIAEIIVVDNAPDQSARPVVEAFSKGTPIRYVQALPPGVATARNAGLAAIQAPYVAFLDDDEEAHRDWIGALFDAHNRFEADVTFGPVSGRAPDAPAWKRPYIERFFSRTGPATSGLTSNLYGCGNSLMTRATALPGDAPFETVADKTGGEDDRLFLALRSRGGRFAWASDALVYEHPTPSRSTLGYAFLRAVAFGQGPPRGCIRAGDYLGALRWMALGCAQAAVCGLIALAAFAALHPSCLDLVDKALRGIGKVFWFAPLDFYGAASVEARAGMAKRTVKATNISQTTSL